MAKETSIDAGRPIFLADSPRLLLLVHLVALGGWQPTWRFYM